MQIQVSVNTEIGWSKAIMTWSTTEPTVDPLWQKHLDCLEALNKTSAVANGNGMCVFIIIYNRLFMMLWLLLMTQSNKQTERAYDLVERFNKVHTFSKAYA